MTWFDRLGEPLKKLILGVIAFAAALGPLSLLFSLHIYIVAGLIKTYEKLKGTFSGIQAFLLGTKSLYIAAAIAVGILVNEIVKLIRGSDPLKKMYKELNTEVTKEIFSLDSLFTKLKSANVGTKDRADTIKMINSRYGEYLSKLLTEKSTLEDVTKAQNEATKALVANISVKKYTEELEKQKGGVAEATEKYFGNIMTSWASVFGADRLGEFVKGLNKAMNDAVAAGAGKDASGWAKSFIVLEKFYSDFVTKMGAGSEKGLMFSKFSGAFYALLPIMREAKKAMSDLDAKIIAFGNTNKWKFIPEVLDKVRDFRRAYPGVETGIDGGVKEGNIAAIARSGVDVIYVGSAVFLQPDPAASYRRLQALAETATPVR